MEGAADGTQLLAGSEGLGLELVHSADGVGYEPGAYGGLSVRVPDVGAAVEAAVAAGGSVVAPVAEVPYGASLEPLEDDEDVAGFEGGGLAGEEEEAREREQTRSGHTISTRFATKID